MLGKLLDGIITNGTGVSSNRFFSLILMIALLIYFAVFLIFDIPIEKIELISNSILYLIMTLVGVKGLEKIGHEIASGRNSNGKNDETK